MMRFSLARILNRRKKDVGRTLGALSLIAIGYGQPLAAEQPSKKSDVEGPGVEFRWVGRNLTKNEIQVFNGVAPRKGSFQALLTAHLSPLPNNSASDTTCTATFVGPNVLLTAAHCVMRDQPHEASPIKLKVKDYTLIFSCTANPSYASLLPGFEPRSDADYALCYTKPDAPRPGELALIQPEWINVTPLEGKVDLLLAGYGCTKWTWNHEREAYDPLYVDAVLTVGDIIVQASGPESPSLVSKSDGKTQSAVCSGDSGGPAFSGVTVANMDARRDIRAIASSIEYRSVTSKLASLGTSEFRRFIACWRGAHPGYAIQIRPSTFDADVAARQCET